jgi:hypothetical protein
MKYRKIYIVHMVLLRGPQEMQEYYIGISLYMVLTAYFLFLVTIQTVLNGDDYRLLGSNATQFGGMDHLHLQG